MADTVPFGFSDVSASDKQRLVDGVFARVANRYDLMNDLMSGGLHRAWKDAFVAMLAPPRHSRLPYAVLDLAGGTGDVAFRIVEASIAHVTVADASREMLAVGRDRARGFGHARRVDFVETSAERLPFEDHAFDAATVAFGIRNFADIPAALAEARRVLRPGGRFLCLEFSRLDVAVLDRLYDLYSFNVIPRIAEWVIGDPAPYRYLVESIRRFPNQARFAAMIAAAGFARVACRNLSGGVAAIHSGWKL
jgi:demethylmenaquinone methyltransferase/2-methoxy-6-polyprenyl-1,4-benzoquinol methylase